MKVEPGLFLKFFDGNRLDLGCMAPKWEKLARGDQGVGDLVDRGEVAQ